MSRPRFVAAALSAALLVSVLPGLAAAQIEDEITPEDVNWTLLTFDFDESTNNVPLGVEATLFMKDGEVSGNGGCNTFFGTYELDGDSINFSGEMGMTLALCEETAQFVEDDSVPLLATVSSWSIDGNLLHLADDAGNVVLTYEEPVVDITGTDIIALDTTLAGLGAEIEALRENVLGHRIPNLRNQVNAIQAHVDSIEVDLAKQNVSGLRSRVKANEAVLAEITRRYVNLRSNVRDLRTRIRALEAATFRAVPQE